MRECRDCQIIIGVWSRLMLCARIFRCSHSTDKTDCCCMVVGDPRLQIRRQVGTLACFFPSLTLVREHPEYHEGDDTAAPRLEPSFFRCAASTHMGHPPEAYSPGFLPNFDVHMRRNECHGIITRRSASL